MENIIIIAVLAVAAVIGALYTVKHFRGRGGCCGGGSFRTRRKRLKNVLYQKNFPVEGMHCENCKNRVEEIINDMPDLAGRVNLKKRELTVFYAAQIDDELIKARLERAGYHCRE